jgi:hypothetical protein
MSRIAPVPDLERSGYTNTGYFKDEDKITNMKQILAHSPASLQAYMQWYPLYGEIKKILGERNAYLYAFAISTAANCGLCATIFRKLLVDAGEDPEQLLLSNDEKDLVDFGTAIAKYNGNIANCVYNCIAKKYAKDEMVTLVAFAGQMIASNIFNNVVETDVDEYLKAYQPAVRSIWRKA